MNPALRCLSAAALAVGGFLLSGGAALAAVRPTPLPAPAPQPLPAPRPMPLPAPVPGGGSGGGTTTGSGGSVSIAPLPELKWFELDSGLAKGREEHKPVVVVFTTKAFKGPGTFESALLREALTKSEAIPVRVLPPEAPTVAAKASPDERKALDDQYQEALRKYRELAGKYGAAANPTMIFLSPDAEAIGTLAAPDVSQVNQYLSGLGKAVKDLEQRKAKAAAGNAPPAAR